MDVTTLKLPRGLKRRIGPVARRSGKTPHAWMVETLKREAERAELHEEFIAQALAAAAKVDAGGPLYAAEDVHTYILAKAAGRKVRRPLAGKRSAR